MWSCHCSAPRLWRWSPGSQARQPAAPVLPSILLHVSRKKPRIAGELRLRVVSSDDPESFESGSDLLLPNDRLWTRSLNSLSKYYLPLYEKLREERLVPDDLDTFLSTLASKRLCYRRSNLLYTLNDKFIVDFSIRYSALFIITEQGVEAIKIHNLFFDDRKMYCRAPYTCIYKLPFLDTLILIVLMEL